MSELRDNLNAVGGVVGHNAGFICIDLLAEKHGIKLALHPDDPPLPKLGGVARIFTSLDAIKKGINTLTLHTRYGRKNNKRSIAER